MTSSRARSLSLFVCLLVALGQPAGAQDTPPSDPSSAINYINAWEHEIGSYGTDQHSIRILSVPISITLRSLRRHPWGIKLRLTGMAGVHGFDTPEGEVSVTAVGLVPGIEFLLPIGPRSTLRPHADFGAGTDLDSKRTVWMTALGLRSEFIFPWKRFYLGLAPGLRFSTSWPHPTRESERFLDALLRTDARHPLWFKIKSYQPDFGPYVEYGYYIDGLEFTSISGESTEQKERWELGVSVGFRDERPKIWLFRVPRVSVGWRFGGGASGIRIRIGGDWVSRM